MAALAIQHGGKISSPNGYSLDVKGEVGKRIVADWDRWSKSHRNFFGNLRI
jgi:hypothetical protein